MFHSDKPNHLVCCGSCLEDGEDLAILQAAASGHALVSPMPITGLLLNLIGIQYPLLSSRAPTYPSAVPPFFAICYQCVQALLEMDPNHRFLSDAAGRTAVHLAAAYGEVGCLQALIHFGENCR